MTTPSLPTPAAMDFSHHCMQSPMNMYLAVFLIVALAVLTVISDRTHSEVSRGIGVLVSAPDLRRALELAERADAGLTSQQRPYRVVIAVSSDWTHHRPPVSTIFPDSTEVLLVDDRAVRRVPREVFDMREKRMWDRGVSFRSTQNRRVVVATPVTTTCTGGWRLSR